MSTEIAKILKTGRNKDACLDVTQFYGGDKACVMLQLTQGFGVGIDEPGFIN